MNASEEKALDLVVRRLHRKFPDVPLESLEREVRRIYLDFEGSRVRTYVPILVEKEVTASVRTRPVA